jgi:hypothetical protein
MKERPVVDHAPTCLPDAELYEVAVRYLDSQLSPEEIFCFEARLANDRASRDALLDVCFQMAMITESPRGCTLSLLEDGETTFIGNAMAGDEGSSHSAEDPDSQLPSPDAVAFPTIGIPITTIPGTVGFFSSDWSLSYLIATVVCGIAALIGSLIYVSRYEQVVDDTPSSAAKHQLEPLPKVETVGRITGMVDCKWAKGSDPLRGNDVVSLGREFKLESGLVEIGYNTGAKVILQGPVAYRVESKNGGFMSVGKLTGKVATASAKGFAIRTPTATVTDLGTEFGVEVWPDRHEDVVVLAGQVRVEARGRHNAAGQVRTLQVGQTARIDAKAATLIVGTGPAENMNRFVRALRVSAESLPTAVITSANLVLWLKADAIGNISDGETVNTWRDSSGKHNHMYHASDTLPIYVSGQRSGLNGMPVLRFNGNEKLCGSLDTDPQTPGIQTLSTPFTIFSVVRNADSSHDRVVRAYFGGDRFHMAFGMSQYRDDLKNSFLAYAPWAPSTLEPLNLLNTNWNIHAYTLDSLVQHDWTWYYNGTAIQGVGLTSGTPQQYEDTVYIGSSNYGNENWLGDLAEILLYDRVLTKSELNQVGSYLARKYGIGTTWAAPKPNENAK